MSKHLFEDCLQKFLAGKTRILVTHQLQYLKNVDKIILMDQGHIRIFSDYEQLLNDYPEYESLLAKENKESNTNLSTERLEKTNYKSSTVSLRV